MDEALQPLATFSSVNATTIKFNITITSGDIPGEITIMCSSISSDSFQVYTIMEETLAYSKQIVEYITNLAEGETYICCAHQDLVTQIAPIDYCQDISLPDHIG